MFKLSILTAACALVSFAVGLHWGPVGVATAATICFTALVVPSAIYAFDKSPVTLPQAGAALIRPGVFSALVGLTGITVHHLSEPANPATVVAVVLITALAVTGCAFVLWRPIREDARLILSLAYK
jgi:hypothetical protein